MGDLRDMIVAAAVGGGLGGLPSTLHAVATGGDVLEPIRAAGTLLVPRSRRERRLLAAGVGAHVLVSAAWAAVLVPALRRSRWPVAAGGLAGLGIFALTRTVAHRRVPRLAALPALPQAGDHLAFGLLVGLVVGRGGRTVRRG